MVRAAVRACWSAVTVISEITARISRLRSRGVVEGASKTARMSAPAAASHRTSSSVRELGWRACSAASEASAAVTAASLVAGPFDGELEGLQPLGPGGPGVGQRPGGGRQRGRLQRGEDLRQDRFLQFPAARALAVGRLAAQVGGLGGAVVAGPDPAAAAAVIPGAHHPAAAAAAQQALQQPAALPDRATALPGRGSAVRVQLLLIAQVV